MQLVQEKNGKMYSVKSSELAGVFTETEIKILSLLAKKPSYPKDVSKSLRMHEQNIYYHVHALEKRGIIKVMRKEERGGALAKIYELTSPSFFVKFKELEEAKKIPSSVPNFLEPFVISNNLNAKIVVGSPDPHGPERARSRDASYAIDLALFLGTFITKAESAVKLDTEISKDELKENLVLVGGPVINRIKKEINNKLPVRFDERKNIYSTITKKTYRSDDCGLIVKIQNPFSKSNYILAIAGKRYSGTRAAILAFVKKFDEISKKNFHVVEGIDNDGDGIVDDVRVLE